jgi:hypothetical protein
MGRILLALVAFASLSMAPPTQAATTTTSYSVTSSVGSGAFSLDFDNVASVYSIRTFDLSLGAVFETPTIGLNTNVAPLLGIEDDTNGQGLLAGGTNDFFFDFDPTLASQTAHLSYAFTGFDDIADSSVTIMLVGSHSVSGTTTTNYILTSSVGSGAFSLDFDNVASVYSVHTFDLSLGAVFETPTVALNTNVAPLLGIEDDTSGPGLLAGGTNDFLFAFDPMLASQTVDLSYAFTGFGDIADRFVTITQGPAPVPEPSTWVTLLLGFSATGWAIRSRKRARVHAKQGSTGWRVNCDHLKRALTIQPDDPVARIPGPGHPASVN